MPGIIQKYPRGLFDFLGMVGTGDAPRDMPGTVQATVDLTDFYASEASDSATATGTVQNVSDSITLAVPAGELWRMTAVAYQFRVGAAGELGRLSLIMQTQNGSRNRVDCMPSVLTANAANALIGRSLILERPIFLRPGNGLELIVEDITVAAARNATLEALFQRIRV